MQIKLISFWGAETNPYACAEKACNGGGYFQPAGGCLVEVEGKGPVVVYYYDGDLGDFGWTADWTLQAPNGTTWCWTEGNSGDCRIDPPHVVEAIRDAIYDKLGVDPADLQHLAYEAVHMAAYQFGSPEQ